MTRVLRAIVAAVCLTIGRIQAPGGKCLRLQPKHLTRHVFIAGGSGKGKTKLLVGFIRQILGTGAGITVVDPHGELIDETIDWMSARGVDPARVQALRAGPDSCFALDPFVDGPPAELVLGREGWLRSVCDRLFSAFVRNVSLAEQEMMKLLKRWFKAGCYLCGLDLGGRHLGLAHLPKLFQPDLDDFDRIILEVTPHIRTDYGREVLDDFLMLQKAGPTLRAGLVGSTINLLRETLGTFVRLMFGGHAESLSQRDVILGSMAQLVDCRKDSTSSREEGRTVGGLVLNLLIDAAERLGPLESRAPEQRVLHYVVIDEAENFIGEDIRMGFSELRKFGIVVVLAIQDVSCLKKGELDLINRVVSQCGLRLVFQQKAFEDLEILGKSLFYSGEIDWTPVTTYQVLPDGFDWVETQSVSCGVSTSHGTSNTTSRGTSHGTSHTTMTSEGIQRSVSQALSEGASQGTNVSLTSGQSTGVSAGTSSNSGATVSRSETAGTGSSISEQKAVSSGLATSTSRSDGEGRSVSRSESADADGKPRGQVDGSSSSRQTTSGKTESENVGQSHSTGSTVTQNQSVTEGASASQGSGTSLTVNDGASTSLSVGVNAGTNISRTNGQTEGESRQSGESFGVTTGTQESSSVGHSAQESRSVTVTRQQVPLPRHRIITTQSGIKVPLDVQLAQVYQRLATLGDRMLVAHVDGLSMTFLLRTHDVRCPYEERGIAMTYEQRIENRTLFAARVREASPCYFRPASIQQQIEVKQPSFDDELL